MRRKTSAGRPLLDLRGIDALTRLRYAVTPKPLTVNPKTLNPKSNQSVYRVCPAEQALR